MSLDISDAESSLGVRSVNSSIMDYDEYDNDGFSDDDDGAAALDVDDDDDDDDVDIGELDSLQVVQPRARPQRPASARPRGRPVSAARSRPRAAVAPSGFSLFDSGGGEKEVEDDDDVDDGESGLISSLTLFVCAHSLLVSLSLSLCLSLCAPLPPPQAETYSDDDYEEVDDDGGGGGGGGGGDNDQPRSEFRGGEARRIIAVHVESKGEQQQQQVR